MAYGRCPCCGRCPNCGQKVIGEPIRWEYPNWEVSPPKWVEPKPTWVAPYPGWGGIEVTNIS